VTSNSSKEIYSAEQRRLVPAILNRIIPWEDPLPGAGDLGIADFIERAIALTPDACRIFLAGIDEIDFTAMSQTAAAFADLPTDRQDQMLKIVELSHPFFFEELVGLTYAGYYVNPRVLVALGRSARPPQPIGYVLPAFDSALLDRVRARGPVFRIVPS
jgi:hypothetical protein